MTKLNLSDSFSDWSPGAGIYPVYAGMGASDAPPRVLVMLSKMASELYRRGWALRSGGAIGADLAFEEGAQNRKETIFPKDATLEAHAVAEKMVPGWRTWRPLAKKLVARKVMIILGPKLDRPVSFLLCWTHGGEVIGGTGHAIRIAEAHGVPVHNLFKSDFGADLAVVDMIKVQRLAEQLLE